MPKPLTPMSVRASPLPPPDTSPDITDVLRRRAAMATDGESAGVLHQAADMISALKAQLAKLTAEVEELRNPPQAIDETIAIVPVEALRVARAQFDYLADGFAKAGDVISQTICEIGACAIDKALGAGMPDGRRTSNWRDGAADEI